MSKLYAGKCMYCGNEVYYQGGETLIKCGKCRETLVVAEFANEQQRMEAALVEGEKARKALQEAETERDQAREQLLQTITTIEQLKDGQEDSREQLDKTRQDILSQQIKERAALFRQAEDFYLDMKYDQAEEYYRKAIIKGEGGAEIYWRILLCHYGVQYRLSDKEKKFVPTILQPDLTAPAEMSDRKNLFAQCKNEEEKQHYTRQLGEIDKVLQAYRLYHSDTEYDVFISVKQKNGKGGNTPDSDKASDLYDTLKSWGFKVFNSRRTPPPAGELYEPYIFSAINSSRVMIVVGTKKEYMDSGWVKDEWTRFSWLKSHEEKTTGQSKRLLFCYLANGMKAESIPDGLNPNKQAVIEGPTVESVLRENLKNAFPQKFTDPHQQPNVTHNPTRLQEDADKLVKKRLDLAMTYIHQGKFQNAEAEIDGPDLVRIAPNDPNLWLCKALIHAKVRNPDDLYYAGPELRQNEELDTAIEKASGSQKKQLEEYLAWSDFVPAEFPDGSVGIRQYLGREKAPAIPTVLKNKVVTRIMDSCFENSQALDHVVIPASVTSIGKRAFAGCSSLTEIVIPRSMNQIGLEAFMGCASLQAIRVEEGNRAFASVDGVLFTKILNGSTLICYPPGRNAYVYKMPDFVTSIANCAFCRCTLLRQVIMQNTIDSIAGHAFLDCPQLEIYGHFGSNVEKYADEHNIPFHDKDLEMEEYSHYLIAQKYLDCSDNSKISVAVEELSRIKNTLKDEVNRDKYIQLVIKWKKRLSFGYKRISIIQGVFGTILIIVLLFIFLLLILNHTECPIWSNDSYPLNFLLSIGDWFFSLLKPFGLNNVISVHSEKCTSILALYSLGGLFLIIGALSGVLAIGFFGSWLKNTNHRKQLKKERSDTFEILIDNKRIKDRINEVCRIDESYELWHGICNQLAIALGIAATLFGAYFTRDYLVGNLASEGLKLVLMALLGFIVGWAIKLLSVYLLDSKAVIGKQRMAKYKENIRIWDELHIGDVLQDKRFGSVQECANTEQERREINEPIEKGNPE